MLRRFVTGVNKPGMRPSGWPFGFPLSPVKEQTTVSSVKVFVSVNDLDSGLAVCGFRGAIFRRAGKNLRKADNSFVMYVCPSVRMEQLGSHWTDLHEI